MALPPDFNTNPRNFLLFPKGLHDSFDSGRVALIPSTAGVRIRVLRPDRMSPVVSGLDGRELYLPLANGTPSRVPFKRVLGWMGWLARGSIEISGGVVGELEASFAASQSSEGNGRLRAMVERARDCEKVSSRRPSAV